MHTSLLLLWSLNVYNIEYGLGMALNQRWFGWLLFSFGNGARTPGPICNLPYRSFCSLKTFFLSLVCFYSNEPVFRASILWARFDFQQIALRFSPCTQTPIHTYYATLCKALCVCVCIEKKPDAKRIITYSNSFKWLTVTYLQHFIGARFVVCARRRRSILAMETVCFCDYSFAFGKSICAKWSALNFLHLNLSHLLRSLEMSQLTGFNELGQQKKVPAKTFHFVCENPINCSRNDIGLQLNIAISSVTMQFSLLKFNIDSVYTFRWLLAHTQFDGMVLCCPSTVSTLYASFAVHNHAHTHTHYQIATISYFQQNRWFCLHVKSMPGDRITELRPRTLESWLVYWSTTNLINWR